LHHARFDYGEGFCLYNDVAFCGKYLLQEYKLDRILILDIDAHTGNGIYHYFQEEPRVLFIDVHQDPRGIFPYTGFADEIGTGKGKGFTINVPMPLYAGNECYQMTFESIVGPVTREFQPQIIICNGGADTHYLDNLTSLGLNLAGFRMLGERVSAMAEICGGKVIDLIASGYTRAVLPYCWMSTIAGLAGFNLHIDKPVLIPAELKREQPIDRTRQVIDEVKSHLKDYWACLR
jgi:acetoin utilization protein AcuC